MYHSQELLEEIKKECEYERVFSLFEESFLNYKHLFDVSNRIVMDIYKFNDHGPSHLLLTAKRSLQILKILKNFNYQTTLEKIGKPLEYSYFVVLFGSLFHDVGNSIHRRDHYVFSVILSEKIIEEISNKFCENPYDSFLLKTFTLNAIYTHDENVECTTIEGSCVSVADGCDIEEGRSRLAYSLDKKDIHAVSALAIQSINIQSYTHTIPILISVNMKHLAGIFQVDEILGKKIRSSLLRGLVKIKIDHQGEIIEKIF
ncbi:MAG: metal-dependent phosphohydrolase [Candidatus Woesearchaeota archaeon]